MTLFDGLLDRAVGYALGSLGAVTSEQLAGPTPCRAWDLRALLRHLDDSLAALHEGLTSGRVATLPASGSVVEDPVASVRARAVELIGQPESSDTVAIADHALQAGLLIVVGALEVTAHGWDIGQACCLGRPIPPRLAADLLALAPIVITDETRPEQFGMPVAVSEAASHSDRLIAFLGRDPTA
jgi:uncharacterized protein (TIGR03086 family)